MSEGADSVAQTCGNSLTTLADEGQRDATTTAAATTTATQQPEPPELPSSSTAATTTTTISTSTSTSYTSRRPRCGTGGPPPSPYMWIDGRQLRSALVWVRKSIEASEPPRRVSFPSNDSHLVTGYLEPANPWRHTENVNHEDLIFAYKESCVRHNTEPLENVLVQLETLDISYDRCEELSLEGQTLNQDHCEPLEEILKRVQFNKINLEATSLNDESSVILFDMLEYYESARHLNISCNPQIGPRGWQACSHMIKKTQCLEQLEARDVTLNEQYMNILSRALRLVCHLHVLKLENCGLSGRAIVILVTALKMNSGIRELYLADNGLDLYDAIQLGSLLRTNNHLQLLDISNNNVQDDGVRDILEGLINQVNEDKTGKGLSILILWNNRLTSKSSPYISRIIALSKTLETLNIGQNMLTDETLSIVNESLKNNRVLLQLGMQSTELTCDGIITLAEIMETNQVLQRIDLRDNSIQLRGMQALVNVMKKNKSITQIDLDDKPRIRIDGPLHQYVEMVTEIRSYCNQNEERHLLEQSTEDAESPQHPSRLLNASSRKISLTCQTLPCPSRSAASLVAADESTARTMLEPKRTSGGRLRSPAPSPIPSPVASPIPSPSRNRFVVCRVPEASLRSIDSSASSSPVTPPSLGSSPTCFFSSGSSGPSRFRVSVVESVSTSHSPSPRSVVTSPSGNVTIGFNFKVSADSDDSGSETKTETATKDVGGNAATVDALDNVVSVTRGTLSIRENVAENENCCAVGAKGEEARLHEHEFETPSVADDNAISEYGRKRDYEAMKIEEARSDVERQSGRSENVPITHEEVRNETVSPSDVEIDFENVTTIRDAEAIETIEDHRRIVYTSTKELQVPAYPDEDTASMKIGVVEDGTSSSTIKSSLDNTVTGSSMISIMEAISSNVLESSPNITLGGSSLSTTTSSQPPEHASTSVQKHKSSLEKLLSLFQYPSSFFSDSSNVAMNTRASVQENVSGVMAFGDKLQQYLKEGRAKVSTDNSSWSSEHESPSRTNRCVKLNVSQLQNLTGIFTSFKLEPPASLVEQGTKFFGQVRNQNVNNSETSSKGSTAEVARKADENLINQENRQVTRNDDGKNLACQGKSKVRKNDEANTFAQGENRIIRHDRKNCACQERHQQRIAGDEKGLINQEKNQIAKRGKQDSFGRSENRVTRNDEGNLVDQRKNQITRNAENSLLGQERNQVARDDEEDLLDQGENKIERNEQHMLFDQPARDEKNVIDQEENQVSSDEGILFGQMGNQVTGINNKEDLEDWEKKRVDEVVDKTRDDSQIVVKDGEDLHVQGEVASDKKDDVKDREKVAVRNNESSEGRKESSAASDDKKDSVYARIKTEEDLCSVCKLQRAESDRGDKLLPESVQSKNDFADKDLVLEKEGGIATTNTAVPLSPTSRFTVCVAVKLTDIPEYSVLELSEADVIGSNDAKRVERNDHGDQQEHANENLECIERYDAEHLHDDDLQRSVEHDVTVLEVLENNDAKCLERDGAAGGANAVAARTCDTTTTDSINQTSDSSFPICNITRDREVVDSVSVASASMGAATDDAETVTSAPDAGRITPAPLDNVEALPALLENVDVDDYLNDEVTSSKRRVADEDRQCDFTKKEDEEVIKMEEKEEGEKGEQDSAEFLEDACRDTAHCKSTSVNIKLESSASGTTSLVPENQGASSEWLCEQQPPVPNNVNVHRTTLKDTTEDHSEIAANDVDKRIDPTILVTPYETSANLDKSDAEELIFCMTDVSTDGTSVEDELSPGVTSRCLPNDIAKVANNTYFELTAATTPATATLLIENPEDLHRNSQDSGIDEAAMTIDDTVVVVDANPLPPMRSSLQESVDSGIESECSSICIRMESAVERTLETVAATKKSLRDDSEIPHERDDGDVDDDDDDGGDDDDDGGDGDDDDDDGDDDDGNDFREFTSNFLAKETRLIDNDSVSGIARSYLNSIKCAVVNATRPVAGMASGASLGVVVADEGVACPAAPVIAHSPAAVHGTSPK